MYIADAEVLSRILEGFTSTPDECWFCLWEGINIIRLSDGTEGSQQVHLVPPEGRGGPTVRLPFSRNYHLFEGPARNVNDPPFGDEWGLTPNIWWPEDRAWVVVTEIDFAWTYVGGKEDLIGRLLREPALEVIRCDPFAPIPWS